MILEDGTLRFELRGGDKVIKASIDMMVLELACNEVVQVHKPQIRDDGRYQTTPEIMVALAERITPFCKFSEPYDLTPSQATELWIHSGEMMASVKKNTLSQPTSPGTTPELTLSAPATPTAAAGSPTGPQTLASAANDLPGCC